MEELTLDELKKLRYVLDASPVLPDRELESLRDKVRQACKMASGKQEASEVEVS